MNFVTKIISLIIGLAFGALIWVSLGNLLNSVTSSALVVGGLSGVMAFLGGVLANVIAEKLLGISDEADV